MRRESRTSFAGDTSQACFHGCFLASFPNLTRTPNPDQLTSAAASRVGFAAATASSLFPSARFTNHESLPSIPEAFSIFKQAYPQYTKAEDCDQIRAHQYPHLSLSNRVCLDYTGFGLFSHSQHQSISMDGSSSSSSSSSRPRPASSDPNFPFFEVSYKSANLNSQVLLGDGENPMESAIRRRIMRFLNLSETQYGMVFTANRASALKLLAESYLFQLNPRLLTVYDHESEAIGAMTESSRKRGAKVSSASFSWPDLQIDSGKLKKMVMGKGRKKGKRGLFVFPLLSRVTGARYSYQWMGLAQESGWNVLLDAGALGPKDMDTLGLSLFRPDFLICSFYKVFGENPSGFGCLFVKMSSISVLEATCMARSVGIASIVPANNHVPHCEDQPSNPQSTGETPGRLSNQTEKTPPSDRQQMNGIKNSQASESCGAEVWHKAEEPLPCEIKEAENRDSGPNEKAKKLPSENDQNNVVCTGLDHADSVGLQLISSRVRFLINWLVNALMKLRHPNPEKGKRLVKIYGPRVNFDRGPAVAFNVYDWKGEKIEATLVQKLADRCNISLGYGFLQNICFPEKLGDDRDRILETRASGGRTRDGRSKQEAAASGVMVVTASVSFLSNFQDVYKLWAFVAKFLDADFVEKERWRYMALNQKAVEV